MTTKYFNITKIILFCTVLISFNSKAQKLATFRKAEDSLSTLCKKIINTDNYQIDSITNTLLIKYFRNTLEQDSSFYYNFSSTNYISCISSEDLLVKIYTWSLINNDFKYSYFGFIQYLDKKTNKVLIIDLIDKAFQTKVPQQKLLNAKNWFGAQYYKIIDVDCGEKKYYTLLGWNGKDALSNYKIIDVLSFDQKCQPIFGANIFEKDNERPMRIIFEYSEKTTMALRFEKQLVKKRQLPKYMIIFDRLSPMNSSLIGQYQFYLPETNVFDAFVLKHDKWVFTPDVDARNRQMEQQKQKKQKSENLIPH